LAVRSPHTHFLFNQSKKNYRGNLVIGYSKWFGEDFSSTSEQMPEMVFTALRVLHQVPREIREKILILAFGHWNVTEDFSKN